MLLFSRPTIVVMILIIHFVSYLICHPRSDWKVQHCPSVVSSSPDHNQSIFSDREYPPRQSQAPCPSHLVERREISVPIWDLPSLEGCEVEVIGSWQLTRLVTGDCSGVVCVSWEPGTDWVRPSLYRPPPPSPASLPQHQTTSPHPTLSPRPLG